MCSDTAVCLVLSVLGNHSEDQPLLPTPTVFYRLDRTIVGLVSNATQDPGLCLCSTPSEAFPAAEQDPYMSVSTGE